MLQQALRSFNWIDVFFIIIILLISYNARRQGLVVEIFKLLGTVVALYLAFHYYTTVSAEVRTHYLKIKLPEHFISTHCFVLLALAGYFAVFVLRTLFLLVFRIEPVQNLQQWGGLTIGAMRAILVAGFIAYFFLASGLPYLRASVGHSFSGRYAMRTGIFTYNGLWELIMSKFMTGEKLNPLPHQAERSLSTSYPR
jgi:uncharacterized membrane protein required for colicin V production